jgi:hypothetical protein
MPRLPIRLIATAATLVLALSGTSAVAVDGPSQRVLGAAEQYAGADHHASAVARRGTRARPHKRAHKPKRRPHKRGRRHRRKAKAKKLAGPPVQTPSSSSAPAPPTSSSPAQVPPVSSEVPIVPISEAPTGPVGPTGGSPPEGCFADPESCGYPETQNTGVANCAALKPSGGKTITQAETIEGLDITGQVVVDAAGVKLNHDCIEVDGNEEAESAAVILDSGASDFTISGSTIRGKNTTTESIEEALRNNYSNAGATASGDRIENCSECLHQTWTLTGSYVDADGEQHADESGRAHAEDWWFDEGTISANDDTLLNPSKQTAVIFAEGGSGVCENHETVTNSLLAGGGYTFYLCAHSTGDGTSSIDIKDNRFARMVCAKAEIANYEERGGFGCGPEVPEGSYFYYGEGSGGYFPRGGFFGTVYEGEGNYDGSAGWGGNYWDNDLQAVEAP